MALVGAARGVKAAMVSALWRFYGVDRGEILGDGIDIGELNKQELRRHLGLVLQDVFLFSGDITANISLGDRGISEARVIEAASRAHIAPFIDRLPGRHQAGAEERGLAVAVGADDGDDLPRRHLERDAGERLRVAVEHVERAHLEQRRAHTSVSSPR